MTRSTYLTFALISALAVTGCKLTLVRDSSTSSVLPQLSEYPSTPIYSAAPTLPLTWGLENGTAESFEVSVYSGAGCSGTPISTATVTTQAYALTGLTNGGTYSVRIVGQNSKGSGAPICTPAIVIDTQAPGVPTFIDPSANLTLGSTSYTFNWSASDVGVSGLRSTDTYRVERFSAAGCAGTALSDSYQTAGSLSWSGLANGSTYSIRVTAYDNSGNASSAACSNALTIDTSVPALALSDPTTASSAYARQVGVSVSITNDGSAAKWCLSETQSSQPADTTSCAGGSWVSSRPTTFNLSASDGAKTVYLWIADSANTIRSASVSDAIDLDTTLPANPTVVVRDSNTLNTSATNQSSPALLITADTDATAWCVKEQAGIAAAPSAPLYNDSCFVTTRPTTVALTTTGTRKVYVFTRDVASNVSASYGMAAFAYSTTIPGDPTLALTDTSSSSAVATDSTSVSAAITDSGVLRWCLSETQTTRPAGIHATCNGGAGAAISNYWSTTRPTGHTFANSTNETKTVYLWVGDDANNVSSGTVSDSIIYDSVIPTVSLTGNPANPAATDSATFTFTGDGTGSAIDRFECKLDAGAYATCTSGISYSSLAAGAHTFYVMAYDQAGNASAATSYAWTINLATVEKVYTNNGDWNDYVQNNNGGTDRYDQPDTACNVATAGLYDTICIHGGEKRKVTVTGYASCSGLAITDALGAFDWECKVVGGTATFFTRGLKPSKGLRDLVNATSWKNNSVTITDGGTPIVSSTSSAWWSNPVVALPDNSAGSVIKLDGVDDDTTGPDLAYGAKAVFTLSANASTAGYNLNADKLSLVTLGTAVLRYNGSASTNCSDASGEIGTDYRGMICAGGQKHLWVEANVDGDAAAGSDSDLTFYYCNTKVSRLHRSDFKAGGIALASDADGNFLDQIRIHSVAGNALVIWDGDWNRAHDIQIANTTQKGLWIASTSANNVITQLRASNTNSFGLHVTNSVTNNTIAGALFAKGMSMQALDTSSRNTYTHITTYDAGGISNHMLNTGRDTLNQPLSNTTLAISSSDNLLSQLVIGNVSLSSSSNNQFTQVLRTGFCNVTGGTNPGLAHATCANNGLSDASYSYVDEADLLTSVVGTLSSDDTVNSMAGFSSTYASITDWLNFENIFRLWGTAGAGYSTSGTFYIQDFRLKSTDTRVRERSDLGSSANGAFTSGAACPSAAHGNRAITDQNSAGARTFLTNAMEIIGDSTGNENGLCESNEACIYSPNFGFYQGHGDYASNGTCTFQNGTVTGVTLYGYPSNGI